MAAAVADARPAKVSRVKIKKDKLQAIRLVKNPDILANLAKKKKKGQVFVGFGLESADLAANGAKKMTLKSLELILLQEVTRRKSPFGNKAINAYLMDCLGQVTAYRSIRKQRLAGILVRQAEAIFASKNSD